jgi:hypothetical protein
MTQWAGEAIVDRSDFLVEISLLFMSILAIGLSAWASFR